MGKGAEVCIGDDAARGGAWDGVGVEEECAEGYGQGVQGRSGDDATGGGTRDRLGVDAGSAEGYRQQCRRRCVVHAAG
jgi:hypothetical protein